LSTVRDIYNEVCSVLLEPNGLALGLYTETQFLLDFREVIADFHQESGIIKRAIPLSVTAGQNQVALPDYVLRVEEVFYRGRYLHYIPSFELDNLVRKWRSESSSPRYWHEDRVELKHIGLFPTPSESIANALLVVATTDTGIGSYTLDTQLTGFPDSFLPYLKYGVLATVFGRDGETRDTLRQQYCQSRFQEGCSLAQAISLEGLGEEAPVEE